MTGTIFKVNFKTISLFIFISYIATEILCDISTYRQTQKVLQVMNFPWRKDGMTLQSVAHCSVLQLSIIESRQEPLITEDTIRTSTFIFLKAL